MIYENPNYMTMFPEWLINCLANRYPHSGVPVPKVACSRNFAPPPPQYAENPIKAVRRTLLGGPSQQSHGADELPESMVYRPVRRLGYIGWAKTYLRTPEQRTWYLRLIRIALADLCGREVFDKVIKQYNRKTRGERLPYTDATERPGYPLFNETGRLRWFWKKYYSPYTQTRDSKWVYTSPWAGRSLYDRPLVGGDVVSWIEEGPPGLALQTYRGDPLSRQLVSPEIEATLRHYMDMHIPEIDEMVFGWKMPLELLKEMEDLEATRRTAVRGRIPVDRTEPLHGGMYEVLIDFGDGYYWIHTHSHAICEEVELSQEIAEDPTTTDESVTGHCSTCYNHDEEAVVLREYIQHPEGDYWRPVLHFCINAEGSLGEMKGMSNRIPDPKYHDYIEAFLDLPLVKGSHGGGFMPETNFKLSYFPEEVRDRFWKRRVPPAVGMAKPQLFTWEEALNLFADDSGYDSSLYLRFVSFADPVVEYNDDGYPSPWVEKNYGYSLQELLENLTILPGARQPGGGGASYTPPVKYEAVHRGIEHTIKVIQEAIQQPPGGATDRDIEDAVGHFRDAWRLRLDAWIADAGSWELHHGRGRGRSRGRVPNPDLRDLLFDSFEDAARKGTSETVEENLVNYLNSHAILAKMTVEIEFTPDGDVWDDSLTMNEYEELVLITGESGELTSLKDRARILIPLPTWTNFGIRASDTYVQPIRVDLTPVLLFQEDNPYTLFSAASGRGRRSRYEFDYDLWYDLIDEGLTDAGY